MKIHSTKQILIILLAATAVLLGLHYVTFSFIREASEEVNAMEGETSMLKNQVAEFSKYGPEDLQRLAQSVISRFIPRAGFVKFMETIESEAKTQNISAVIRSVGVEPRSEDEKDDKEIIRLKLETRGSWANTMKFVNYLEHLPYKVVLHGLNLSVAAPEKGQSKVPQWQGRIEITALKFK